ncbi:MAG: hypothetical protein ABI575_07160 [Oxalobacteraceae bacterium]
MEASEKHFSAKNHNKNDRFLEPVWRKPDGKIVAKGWAHDFLDAFRRSEQSQE